MEVWDFPCPMLGIRDFKAKSGRDSGLKVCAGGEIPKITFGITGLHEISGRDYEIEEPCWRPSFKGSCRGLTSGNNRKLPRMLHRVKIQQCFAKKIKKYFIALSMRKRVSRFRCHSATPFQMVKFAIRS